MAIYKELVKQKQAIEAQLAQARAAEVEQVIARIRGLMADYGLTVDDVAPKRGRGRPKASRNTTREPLPPKYRHPKTRQTWSGRGRKPAWIGTKPERFLIQEQE